MARITAMDALSKEFRLNQELCPACKSSKTQQVLVDGQIWWKCSYQGCDGRVSGDRFHFLPGEGLPPKPEPKPKANQA